jgi:RNA-directed DNA polymerase
LLSAGSRQLMFVFADSPQGSRDNDPSDVSEGKAFLLHTANVKEANESAARAVDDPSRLLERAASVTNLARALLNVARNKGAAGVDGRSVEEIVADAPRLLSKLRCALISGAYRPGDIRRVWIPKPGGRRCSKYWSHCLNRRFTTAATDSVRVAVHAPPLLKRRSI